MNGLGAQFAYEELFNRDAGLPPKSIGKRYLVFTPDNELEKQIGKFLQSDKQVNPLRYLRGRCRTNY